MCIRDSSETITSNKINNSGITFNVEMDSGKQTLAPMFNLKNGDKTVAFFTEIRYQGK